MLLSLVRIVTWTLTLGVVSFAAGFFGPILLAPGANQGPLLGIFITGPLGTLVGFVVGITREYLGYTAGPMEVLRGWRSLAEPSFTAFALRAGAMLGGGFLAVYGIGGLRRGEGRGAAASVVIAAALVYYGVTGRVPRRLLR